MPIGQEKYPWYNSCPQGYGIFLTINFKNISYATDRNNIDNHRLYGEYDFL